MRGARAPARSLSARTARAAVLALGAACLAVALVRPARWWALQRGLDAAAAVPWIPPAALAEALGGDAPPLVLDVRPPHEVARGRIPGARQTDPDTDAATLAAEIGDREVVVYCSVGVRSGRLARRLAARGVAVRNLRGAVFQWANAGRPLVTASGAPTATVHPYSAHWARYLRPGARAEPGDGG